jgi:Cof subfamily protein (haloacid dehalogenase superfamily)
MNHNDFGYIALDLDGTILNADYVLSDGVREVLKACRRIGKKVIISTGRVLSSAKGQVSSLEGVDGFVCSNGADIYQGSGQSIAHFHMDKILSQEIYLLARGFDSHYHAYLGDSWCYERRNAYTDYYVKRAGKEGLRMDFDSLGTPEFTKFMFMDDHEKLEPIRMKLIERFGSTVQIVYSAPFMLEIVVAGVSKASGLKLCVEHLRGSLREVIAFGDAENDEEMLLASGMGVAMGNATEELKAKAAAVAPSVDDDGVAVFLKDFFSLQGL